METFFAPIFVTCPVKFLPIPNGFYSSKRWVDGSLDKACPTDLHCSRYTTQCLSVEFLEKTSGWLLHVACLFVQPEEIITHPLCGKSHETTDVVG